MPAKAENWPAEGRPRKTADGFRDAERWRAARHRAIEYETPSFDAWH
jgi:hypothetical protein